MNQVFGLPKEVEQFFAAIELSTLSLQQKIMILKQLESAAREQVMALILENLSLEDQAALGQIVQSAPDQEAVLAFLRERISDLEGQVGQQVRTFKQSVVRDVKQALDKQKDPSLRKQVLRQIQRHLEEGKFAEIRLPFLGI